MFTALVAIYLIIGAIEASKVARNYKGEESRLEYFDFVLDMVLWPKPYVAKFLNTKRK